MTIRTLISATTWSWVCCQSLKFSACCSFSTWCHSCCDLVFQQILPWLSRSSLQPPWTEMTCAVVVSHRPAERRRSSLVVSLPGLEVFPGDLLVSDSAMDYLPCSSFLLSAGQTQRELLPWAQQRGTGTRVRACGMGGMYAMRTWGGAGFPLCGESCYPTPDWLHCQF